MAPSLESLEVKIDTILRKMEELTALQIKVVELEDDVRVLNNKVSDLNSTVAKLNNEMTLLKEKDNDRDQQSRGNAVRLFGLAVSLAIRLAFLRNKRASLPAPSAAEIQAGVKRYSVVEDLTSTTYKKMRELADSLEVDKVWSIDGRLR